MKFEDLPESVQNIAAITLKQLMIDTINEKKEPASKLAEEVRNAFVTLYHPEA